MSTAGEVATTTGAAASGGAVPEWHRRPVADVLAALGSDARGLSSTDAATRLAEHGPNQLEDRGGTSPWRLLWEQLTAVMVLILIGASLLSLALGKYLEAGAIGAIVVLFALLGFVQEYRAEQAIAALRKMAVPNVRVLRDDRPTDVPVAEVVPGDVVQVEAGSIVPADVRLVEVASLRVQEAALTGESESVDKQTDPVDRDDLALGDRRCMAYSGTQVAHGRGTGVVVATGMSTELGHIAALLQDVPHEPTPLQVRLDRIGKQLALVGVIVAFMVMGLGALGGESFSDLVLTAISVAVAVIPEGLPAVVTVTLAIGAQRMLRREALIRKLPAVETLGSVTVICSDKTGTLTQNRMSVAVVDVADLRIDTTGPFDLGGDTAEALLLAGSVLCNDGEIDTAPSPGASAGDGGEPAVLGDPTETALLVAAHRAGIGVDALRAAVPRIGELPFDADRKRMTTLHGPLDGAVPELRELPQDAPFAVTKGAIDGLLGRAGSVWHHGRIEPIDDGWRERILAANDAMAVDGMRVLGIAVRPLVGSESAPSDAELDVDTIEADLTIVGLVGIIDPPRPEVADSVATCRTAGIRPVMITGDHPMTAVAIARQLGIEEGDRVMTGAELEHLDDESLDRATREVSVFARVSPEHKLRIVGSLQRQHHVVAMTGDGVNDAPALKRADIGVAMGITGTDVSKEASDVVLRDDNFATIVAAVEEGRVIYDNLRRFVSFAVAGNLGKILVMLIWPIPYLLAGGDTETAVALLPLQLLWLNLMTDGLLGLSMGVEPAERDVMRRPPHSPGASLWAGGLGRRTTWVGVLIGVTALAVGFTYRELDRVEWQTMLFTSLAFLQVFQALATRSTHDSLWTIGWRSNPTMLGIVALVVGLQLLAVYGPLQGFLDLEPLPAVDLAVAVGTGVALFAVIEAVKAVQRRRGAATVRPPVAAGAH